MLDPTDPEDAWQMRFSNALTTFGLALYDLHHTNPWPQHPAVDKAMSHVATDLWKHGFSVTEIRSALERATADLVTYAAGEEKRGE
jgi:hypothetical protein